MTRHRTGLWGVLVAAGVWVFSPAYSQDGKGHQGEYESENDASSVRPAPRKFEASDVKGIGAAVGGKVSVKGKVHSVYLSGSGKVAKLNLGPNYRTCFK